MSTPDTQLFLQIVESGSLKTTARLLNISASTVSRHLSRLEERLGVQLIVRSTRQTHPTEAGTHYYNGLRQLVAQEQALEANIAGLIDQPQGRLRVAAPASFGARYVMPVLTDLNQRHKDLTIELILGSNFTDIIENNIDVAIRIGNLPDSNLIARKLGLVPRALVASPNYLSQFGEPTTLNDLKKHTFLGYRGGPTKKITLVGPDEKPTTLQVKRGFSVNHVESLLNLAIAGAGLLLGAHWSVEEALSDGRLKLVLPDYHAPAYPLHAVWPPSSYLPAKTRLFVDQIAKIMARTPSITSL